MRLFNHDFLTTFCLKQSYPENDYMLQLCKGKKELQISVSKNIMRFFYACLLFIEL